MEILALLLLGLIAMLAIVPPIIRGKLDESPLSTTQSFQRSMQEMANSIESHNDGEEGLRGAERSPVTARSMSPGYVKKTPSRVSGKKRAAMRRNRILASLTVFTAFWGAAALLSGKAWCLVTFAVACSLLAVYWGLALVIPNLYSSSRVRAAQHSEEIAHSPRRQAS